MTATLALRPGSAARSDGGPAARRVVVRWAWRLFRREWRQQLLVLGLVLVAVAATVIGAAVSVNTPTPTAATFGTAQDLANLSGSGSQLAAQIASLERRFGPVDVIQDQVLGIPGSVNTFSLRAQDPHGPFGRPLLSLLSGRYPTGANEVAVAPGLASILQLHVGSMWSVGGVTRRVTGIVENPERLVANFALVAPGQVSAPTQTTVLFDAPGLAPETRSGPTGPNGQIGSPFGPGINVELRSQAGSNAFNPETISLAGLTLGMLLIALVAVGGFTVLAQRRLRALGMLAAQGATEGNVGLVVKANGVVVGAVGSLAGVGLAVVVWLAYRPHLQSSVGHVIGVWALPWPVIGLAVVLGLVATYLAATRPARAISRTPIVTALSGRPTPPRALHRSALPGVAFLVIAFLLLGYSGSQGQWGRSGGVMGPLVLGLVALVPAIILLSPFCLSVLARLGRRAPIAIRLALRDLDRYRARSGSALAAISLGVLIAVIIAIVASARYANALDYVGPNLSSDQLVLHINNGPGPGPAAIDPTTWASQLRAMGNTAGGLARSLGARDMVELDMTSARLRHAAAGRNWNGPLYVATPSLLRAFGIPASQINPDADILTRRPGMAGLSEMQLIYGGPTKSFSAPGPHVATGPSPSDFPCPTGQCLANPVIQEVGALPSGTSAPNTVITEHAITTLGLPVQTLGWLIQTPKPLDAAQIDAARGAAEGSGMVIETKNDEPTSDQVINLSTIFGIGLALAILAMSVGLIRSETAADLRTLTATGASSRTRRMLTAATAGGLGLAGALLGTVTGYVGVIGWLRGNSLNGGIAALGNVPVANLLAILIGMPLLATIGGWLLAGREPQAIGHQPIE